MCAFTCIFVYMTFVLGLKNSQSNVTHQLLSIWGFFFNWIIYLSNYLEDYFLPVLFLTIFLLEYHFWQLCQDGAIASLLATCRNCTRSPSMWMKALKFFDSVKGCQNRSLGAVLVMPSPPHKKKKNLGTWNGGKQLSAISPQIAPHCCHSLRIFSNHIPTCCHIFQNQNSEFTYDVVAWTIHEPIVTV